MIKMTEYNPEYTRARKRAAALIRARRPELGNLSSLRCHAFVDHRGYHMPGCPLLAKCEELQQLAPELPVLCEVSDQEAGIGPLPKPGGDTWLNTLHENPRRSYDPFHD